MHQLLEGWRITSWKVGYLKLWKSWLKRSWKSCLRMTDRHNVILHYVMEILRKMWRMVIIVTHMASSLFLRSGVHRS